MTYTATVTSQGQVTIPAQFRKKYGLRKNSQVSFTEIGENRIEIKPLKKLESIVGIANPKKPLPKNMSIKQLIKEAREEAAERTYNKYLKEK